MRLAQGRGGEAPDHQFEVPGVYGHPELGLRGERDDVAGVLLRPAFEEQCVCRIGGELGMLGEDIRAESFVKLMVAAVLGSYGCGESFLQTGLADLGGDDEIVLEQDVALGFFGIGSEPEFFDLFDEEAGDVQDVEIENGVFGDGTMAHLEDDVPVGGARLFHLAPRESPEFVYGPGIPADPGVGGRDGFRSQVLSFGMLRGDLPDDVVVHVMSRKNDFHRLQSPSPVSCLRPPFGCPANPVQEHPRRPGRFPLPLCRSQYG